MDSNYITAAELRLIADFCESLEAFDGSEISVGEIPVSDINGETLGYVRMSDGGSWALHKVSEADGV